MDNLFENLFGDILSKAEPFLRSVADELGINIPSKKEKYDVALRGDLDPDNPQSLDDIVVKDVDCFRAEVLSDKSLWLACYLKNSDKPHDRIVFEVTTKKGRLQINVIEYPQSDNITYEPGSIIFENREMKKNGNSKKSTSSS